MRCLVINGTSVRGCSYRLKEAFLEELRPDERIEFYLPKDGPDFCLGCKKCFVEGEDQCPHYAKVNPIWQEMKKSDLIVFVYPVYVMRAPGQVKTLLDHFGVHWFSHRPDKVMFDKKAVIITQSIGAPNGPAQKDVKTSLEWLGVSHIQTLGLGLHEGVIWEELSQKKRSELLSKMKNFAGSLSLKRKSRMKVKVKAIYWMCRSLQRSLRKKSPPDEYSLDLRHWIEEDLI